MVALDILGLRKYLDCTKLLRSLKEPTLMVVLVHQLISQQLKLQCLILHQLRRIPAVGEIVNTQGYILRILELDGPKITKVRVEREN